MKETATLYNGDCMEVLDRLKENSIDCIVTDPPYGLTSITKRFGKDESVPVKEEGNDGSFARLTKGFLGKEWDGSGIELNVNMWRKCWNCLKPGGYLLAFGGSRTFHRIACAIEDAGFELRDTIMWLYGCGFPKATDIGLMIDKRNGVESNVVGSAKSGSNSRAYQSEETTTAGEYEIKEATNEWRGWKTSLKPAFEPIIVARKPCEGSCVDNVLKYGVGALNIEECKVGDEVIGAKTNQDFKYIGNAQKEAGNGSHLSFGQISNAPRVEGGEHIGRYPANVIHDGLEEEWSRYFYSAKASTEDREEGLDSLPTGLLHRMRPDKNEATGLNTEPRFAPQERKNIHPTVKPTELMRYLVRLVAPNGATILDPFMGSGSTGKAVMIENNEKNKDYKFVGIEKEQEYYNIAKARILYAKQNKPQLEEPTNEDITVTEEQICLF